MKIQLDLAIKLMRGAIRDLQIVAALASNHRDDMDERADTEVMDVAGELAELGMRLQGLVWAPDESTTAAE